MKIVVFVRDGVVSRVVCDTPDVKLLVVDDDTEGCDDSTKVTVDSLEAGLDAMAQGANVDYRPSEVSHVFDQVERQLSSPRLAPSLSEQVKYALFV